MTPADGVSSVKASFGPAAGRDGAHLRRTGVRAVAQEHGSNIALAAVATDDGKPNKRNMPPVLGGNYILPTTATRDCSRRRT